MAKILCTICARGGSKGVKNKNIKKINGKPLIAHTIIQAKQSKLFKHIVVSTDCDNIAKISTKFGAEVFFKRDKKLSSDTAGKLDAIKDAFIRSEKYYNTKFDYLIDLDATAPIRKISDIKNAFKQLKKTKAPNLVTATNARKSPYFNQLEIKNGKISLSKPLKNNILRRQDSPKVYDMNSSIYIWDRKSILSQTKIINKDTQLYIMDDITAYDIDTLIDFKIVKMLLKEFNV